MKKLFAILAAALTVFALAACDPENPNTPDNPDNPENPDNPDKPDPGNHEIPTLTLSAANIDVVGIDGDYMAVVDNAAKTVKIHLEYADKENAKALTVAFVNLPQGFSISNDYVRTYDYSAGATQTIAFMYGEVKAVEYVISAVIGPADPKFVTLTVGGVNAISGEVRLPSSMALGSLAVEFTVDPEETQVTVNGETVVSGDELNFSDKMNGVTFTLTLGEAVNTLNVKVITSGYSKVYRLWGHYSNLEDDTWFVTQAKPATENWLRTVAMDDQYIYLAYHGSITKGTSKYAPGAFVVSIADGSVVDTLSTKGMADLASGEAYATHLCSCIRTIADDASSRILQCNMAMASGQYLKVWTWADKDSDPVLALKYDTQGDRYGDKFEVLGDWKDGKLIFLGSFGNPGKALAFSVKDGVINPTPEVLSLEKLPAANYGGAINYYSETEAIACMPGQRPVLYSISNGTYSKVAEGNSKIFGGYDQSFRFFVFNEQKYMAFVREDGGLKDGCLRIMPLNGETLADDFDALEQALIDGDTIHALYFGLGNPDEYPFAGYKQANANADCVVRVIGGETYICAVSSCGAGVSLFKVEK